MGKGNKYTDMMEKLQMPQEEKERVENLLLQENETQKEKYAWCCQQHCKA